MGANALLLIAVATLGWWIPQKRKPPVVTPPAINLTPIPPERYGDWKVLFLDEGLFIAETSNSSGSVLGSLCDQSGCVSYINPQIACKDKAYYPALLNAPGGAFDENLTCRKIAGRNLLVFADEKNVIDAMSIGGEIGIAVPMASGEFAVSRFSLTGAARAYARAAQLAGYQKNGPRDSRL